MSPFVAIVVISQALGALIGAVSAVWGELAYLRAMRDGRLDDAERAHLHHLAQGLRFGMVLLLVASFVLVVTAYLSHDVLQPATTSGYWVLVLLAILVIVVSWALSRRQISFALGSALAFTGWWFLAYLTLGLLPELSFGATIAFFVIATGVFYGLLRYARMLMRPTKRD